MPNRTFIDKSYAITKGEVRLYCAATANEVASPTLLKWNYPQMGMGTTAPGRTYTAAPTTSAGAGGMSTATVGAEGVQSIVRTATGLWTVTLQDAYQRLLGLTGWVALAGGASAVVAVHENTTISSFNVGSQSIIGVSFLSATATLVDPDVDARVHLTFTLQALTAP